MENKFESQYTVIKKAFYSKPQSRFMASIETRIPIQNVCRYVDMLRDENKIAVSKKDYCKISNHLVEFLTTNPEEFPDNNQLELFN